MSKTDCQFKQPLTLKEPILINDKWVSGINIPCNKCGRCIERRKQEWGFRMEQELIESKNALFITLTYDNEHVPINKYGNLTLIKKSIPKKQQWVGYKDKSIQGFFKRLRRNEERSKDTWEHFYHGINPSTDKIKYFACGEYGEDRGRPHYHAIVFNVSSVNIGKSWTFGDIHIGEANHKTIGYLMKYMDKTIGGVKWKGKEKEFQIMSEGIGKAYIDKMKAWHQRNIDILFVSNRRGFNVPMPKYYRDRIYNEDNKADQIRIVNERLEEQRIEDIKKMGEADYAKWKNHTQKFSEIKFKKSIKKRNID